MNGIKTEIINKMIELFSDSKTNFKKIMDMKHYIILKETDSNQLILNKSIQNLIMFFKININQKYEFEQRKEDLFDDFILFINLSIKKLRKEEVKEAYDKFIKWSEKQILNIPSKDKMESYSKLKNYVEIRRYSRKESNTLP